MSPDPAPPRQKAPIAWAMVCLALGMLSLTCFVAGGVLIGLALALISGGHDGR